jgi:hypothetical protein
VSSRAWAGAADSLTARGAPAGANQATPTSSLKCPSLRSSMPPPARCTIQASRMRARTISTSHAKNSTTPGMARPATVLAMAARQKIHAGMIHAGKTATVICEDNHFRVVIDRETAALVPRTSTSEIHRYKANATDKRIQDRPTQKGP